jgi:hypothetical protein
MKKVLHLLLLMTLITTCQQKEKTTKTSAPDPIDLYFERIKGEPAALRSFLWKMPKGGDIHHHALGAVPAEDYLETALEKSLWINPCSYRLYFDETDALSKSDEQALPVTDLLKTKPEIREAIIDHWSVRNHITHGRNGHHWFFATFEKFESAMVGNEPYFLSRLCKAAAEENIQYLETMVAVPGIMQRVAGLTSDKEWNPGISVKDHLEGWFEYLNARQINQWAEYNAEVLDHWMSTTENHGVTLRFQTIGLRIIPEMEVVFAHLLLAFKTALLTDNLVGVNFVAPEDHVVSLAAYETHMAMFRFLKAKYPEVNLSLHAGELAHGKGDATAKDMTSHIDLAITVAGTQRIGHGTDLHSEIRKDEILTLMQRHEIAVEINLESNAVILETDHSNHPLKTYIEAGVPVCIASDDPAILRSDLTHQYEMLVEYYPEISYPQLKKIVTNSVRYSFLNLKDRTAELQRLNTAFKKFERDCLKSIESV